MSHPFAFHAGEILSSRQVIKIKLEDPMKKSLLTIAASLTLASISTRADLTSYQTAISSQNPAFYFHFDNSLVDSVGGTAAFTANGGATFSNDFFGNANDAALFPATTDYLSLANPPAVIGGEGTSNAVGSLSLLFYVPATIPGTGYYFSDGETTGGAANGQPANSAFSFQIASTAGAVTLKVGSKSITSLPAVTSNTWYYLGVTYNLNGTSVGVNGVNAYIGPVGGSLSSVFTQKGGSGNIGSTSTLGDSLTFVVGNKQAAVTAASTAGVAGGEVDELATWSTQLSTTQIQNQFNSIVVPEPSTCAMVGIGILTLFCSRRRIHVHLRG